ncbi:MAG: ribose-phosphate pyrophosphokinae [Solirubrobacteraceae bacterium]|nr:ribose-phosphate pyrophosphokinae [Solirubrobacteraceae bacterium]
MSGAYTLPAVSVQVQPAMATSLPIDYDKRLMLFSGRANPDLAAKIAHKLGVDLGPVTLKTFSNGEVYCRYDESIRGADVFIIQPTCANPELGLSANDALMELLFMIDAAIGANVRTSVDTTLVAPVTVGDGAFTGAGSVITEDVPAGALGIARARQSNIEGYADRRSRSGETQPS